MPSFERTGTSRPEVLYVIAGYPPRVGGAELQAHRVARLLREDFHMRVITGMPEGTSADECMDGVDVHRVPLGSRSGFEVAVLDALLMVGHGIRHARPRVVQGFQLNNTTLAASTLALLYRAPLVIKLTGRVNFEGLVDARHHAQVRYLTNAAAALVTPSHALLTLASGRGVPSHKLHYIPNGVDTQYFRPPDSASRVRIRNQLRFSDSDFVFLWIGRLDPAKGLDRLLSTWGQLRMVRDQARLLIVGDGEAEETAVRLVQRFPESVHRLHMQPDVRPYYRCADATLLTSPAEGLSNTLLEGLASGLPGIVSDAPENVEVGGDSPDFLEVFERGSDESLLAALIDAIDRVERRQDLAVAARKRAEEQYSLGATAAKWTQLYSTLAHRAIPTDGKSAITVRPPSTRDF